MVYDAKQDQQLKASRQREEIKRKEEEAKLTIERAQKKQRLIRNIFNLGKSLIFLILVIFYILLAVSQRKVITSFYSQYGMKNQIFQNP